MKKSEVMFPSIKVAAGKSAVITAVKVCRWINIQTSIYPRNFNNPGYGNLGRNVY